MFKQIQKIEGRVYQVLRSFYWPARVCINMRQRLYGCQNVPPAVHQVTYSKGQADQAHQTPPVRLQQDQPHFGSAKRGLPLHLVRLILEKITNCFTTGLF